MAALASCSSKPAPVEKRSEPSQIFVDQAPTLGGGAKRGSREPPRFITSKLRPSPMTARFPSRYLGAITHRWQPYANGIWDVAELGFDLDTLGPVSSASIHPLGPNPGKTIAISLGGHGQTFRWLARTTDAEMTRSNLLRTGEHVVRGLAAGEVDGSPAIIRCGKSCFTKLTLTPDFAGLLSGVGNDPGYGPDGTALKISFSPDLLPRWREIRHDALCFAGAVISNSDRLRASEPTHQSCVAVDKAIDLTMRK